MKHFNAKMSFKKTWVYNPETGTVTRPESLLIKPLHAMHNLTLWPYTPPRGVVMIMSMII